MHQNSQEIHITYDWTLMLTTCPFNRMRHLEINERENEEKHFNDDETILLKGFDEK